MDREKAEHKRTEHVMREHHEEVVEVRRPRRGREERGGESRGDRNGERSGRRREREVRMAVVPDAAPEAPRREQDPAPSEVAADDGGADRPGRGRIFLSLGEQDGADEAQVREVVSALSPGAELLGVELRRGHSFLNVKPEAMDGLVAALDGKDWKGKRLGAERARRRRR